MCHNLQRILNYFFDLYFNVICTFARHHPTHRKTVGMWSDPTREYTRSTSNSAAQYFALETQSSA